MKGAPLFIPLVSMLAWAASQLAPERGEPLPRKPAFGAQLGPVPAETATRAGLPTGAGAQIVGTVPGLTAERLQVKAGDVLLRVAGQPVQGAASVGAVIRTLESGKPVEVQVWRDGQTIDLKGDLVERPRAVEEGMTVVYDQVVSQGKRIRIIATHPNEGSKFPTIFLIGGIGAYSIDGPFASTAYGNILGPIARSGFAVVRVDKPGQGDSEGPAYTDLKFAEEKDAYLQALRLVKTLDFVDKERIIIFGHSMGGTFGPLVAAEEPVAGLIVSGTVSKTWMEYTLENTRRQTVLAGATPGQTEAQMRELARLNHYLYGEGMSIPQIIEQKPDLADLARAVSPDGKTTSGVGIQFFQELARTNLAEAWEKTDARVLTLWGENEFISTKEDHQWIADWVNARRPGTAEFQVVPQSDHGFFMTTSQADSFARWGRGAQFNPNVIDVITTWLKPFLTS